MKNNYTVIGSVLLVLLVAGYFGYQSNKDKLFKESANKQSTEEKQTAIRLEGKGDDLRSVSLKQGLAIFTLEHKESRIFAVWLKDNQGKNIAPLANEFGNYTGRKSLNIPKDATYLIEVKSRDGGNWIVEIQ